MSESVSIPTLNSPAPDFKALSTHGEITLSQFTSKGKWVVLFSHPYDFTPVCSTEFLGFAKRADEFAAKNVQLIGLSIDSVFSHIAWTRAMFASRRSRTGRARAPASAIPRAGGSACPPRSCGSS